MIHLTLTNYSWLAAAEAVLSDGFVVEFCFIFVLFLCSIIAAFI